MFPDPPGDDLPRIAYSRSPSIFEQVVQYGACDGDCGDASNWVSGVPISDYVVTTYGHIVDMELDSLGVPRFTAGVYVGEYPTSGYITCTDSSCASTTTLAFAYGDYPTSLALTDYDTPRAGFVHDDVTPDNEVDYGSCDADCDDLASWSFQKVTSGGEGVSKVLMALDPSNLPIMAYAQGGTLRVAVASEQPAWGVSSMVGMTNRPSSEKVNCLLVLIVSMGTLLFWKGRRRRR